MAFIFVPGPDGSFTEGDKQTNPDTGIEYAYIEGAWRALGPKIEDEFDTLDERYLKKTGGNLGGSLSVDGTLSFSRGEKDTNQFKVSPNGGLDFNTNIYGLNDGAVRFRTSHTNNESDYVGSHIILDPNNGDPQTKIYNLIEPTKSSMAANKGYVDNSILDLLEGGLPDPPEGENAPPPVVKPAFISWIWDGESSTVSSPASGHAYKHNSNTGNSYMRLSFNSSNGVKLGDGKFEDTNQDWSQYGTHCSIWQWITTNNVNRWKLKRLFYVDATRWNYKPNGEDSAHMEFKISNGYQMGHDWTSLVAGTTFFITVGGMF